MNAVRLSFEILVPKMGSDNNPNRFATDRSIKSPCAFLNPGNSVIQWQIPPFSVRIHSTNAVNSFVWIGSVSFLDTLNLDIVSHIIFSFSIISNFFQSLFNTLKRRSAVFQWDC